MIILIPMAGSDLFFKEQGYSFSKNLTEVQGKPLVQHVYEKLSTIKNAKYIFIVKNEEVDKYHIDNVIKLLEPSSSIYLAENTEGAVCTALLAIEEINNDEPLLIINGDQILTIDISKVIEDFENERLEGGIVTFESVHPRWSFVRLDESGHVVEAAEKRPISRFATAGFYYFKHGKYFVNSAMDMIRKNARVEGRFFICPVYNEMVLKHAKIGIKNIDREQYFSLSNPQGIQEYESYLKFKNGGIYAG